MLSAKGCNFKIRCTYKSIKSKNNSNNHKRTGYCFCWLHQKTFFYGDAESTWSATRTDNIHIQTDIHTQRAKRRLPSSLQHRHDDHSAIIISFSNTWVGLQGCAPVLCKRRRYLYWTPVLFCWGGHNNALMCVSSDRDLPDSQSSTFVICYKEIHSHYQHLQEAY